MVKYIQNVLKGQKYMKLIIASDIHGDAVCCERLLCAADRHGVDKILLLGDLLYHGPRNDLPENYAPKQVIQMLNQNAQRLLCVRGNCEAEVDSMVLSFPVMSDIAWVYDAEKDMSLYMSHGHIYNPECLPPLPDGSIFLYGHTHLYSITEKNGVTCVNPGSVSLPKGGNPKTYALYDGGKISVLTLDGDEQLACT